MANPHNQNSLLADRDGNGMITDQQAHVADLSAVTITDSDTSLGATTQAELQTYFNDIVTAYNSLKAAVEAHGLMADA